MASDDSGFWGRAAARLQSALNKYRRAYLDAAMMLREVAAERDGLVDKVQALEARRAELLALVARISQEVPLQSEVRTAVEQRGALLAEIGSLRAELAARDRERELLKARATDYLGDMLYVLGAARTKAEPWVELVAKLLDGQIRGDCRSDREALIELEASRKLRLRMVQALGLSACVPYTDEQLIEHAERLMFAYLSESASPAQLGFATQSDAGSATKPPWCDSVGCTCRCARCVAHDHCHLGRRSSQ